MSPTTAVAPQFGARTARPARARGKEEVYPQFDAFQLHRVRQQYGMVPGQHRLMRDALDKRGAPGHHPIRVRIKREESNLLSRQNHVATGGRNAACITCVGPLPETLLASTTAQLLRCGECHSMHMADLRSIGFPVNVL